MEWVTVVIQDTSELVQGPYWLWSKTFTTVLLNNSDRTCILVSGQTSFNLPQSQPSTLSNSAWYEQPPPWSQTNFPSQLLRALAGPGGCCCLSCSVQLYVGCSLPIPVWAVPPQSCSGLLMTPAAGSRALALYIRPYVSVLEVRWPEGPAACWHSSRPG